MRLSSLVLPLINLNLNPLIYGNVLSLRLQLRLNPSSKPQATLARSRFKYSPKRPGSVPSPGQPIRVPPRRALARPGARLVSLAAGVHVLNLNSEFRTEPHCNSGNVIRQKRMRTLTLRQHSFKSRLGHWQAASVRPARPIIAFAGLNSPTLHCCPDARSQAARDRFCHTVAGSSMDPWQLWCGCAGSGPSSLPNNRDHSRTTEPPQQTRCKPKRRRRRRVASRSAAASS